MRRWHVDNDTMSGTPEYRLAKFLDSIFKPYMPEIYMLQSTSQFLDYLNNFQIKYSHKLVSFDVSSLFTNVPLEKTIHIITEKIYAEDQLNLTHNQSLRRTFLLIS